MDDYLTKPVSGQALAAMLDPWLPKQALPEQPAMEVTTCASTPGPEALVFDHAKLLERMVGDAALARMFGVGFLQDIPQRIAALRGFLEVGDPASTERQAHTIKGASANVGANALRAVAADLEWAAKAGDLDAIKSSASSEPMKATAFGMAEARRGTTSSCNRKPACGDMCIPFVGGGGP